MPDNEKKIRIRQVSEGEVVEVDDLVAVEEPLEIRVVSGPVGQRKGKGLSITMRTPGSDFELAAGFLVTEGIVRNSRDIESVEHCGAIAEGQETANIVRVELSPETKFDVKNLQRHFYTTSSCGVCGKASLEALNNQDFAAVESDATLSRSVVFEMPARLRENQDLFLSTGGIHAAGLFDLNGNLISVREDVGRHNALDKLIGSRLLSEQFPLDDMVLVVSGRASFELLQKALSAKFPIFIAVGAPSSLAVELATEFGITLIGFTTPSKFNVYSHGDRVK